MKKQWKILQPDAQIVEKISKDLPCNPITATILVNRRIETVAAAARFLESSLQHIRPPFAIKGMDAAVNRIAAAITAKEKILIFGDYDADGVAATALLYDFFRKLGSDITYYIPHRIKEGYSLQPGHIQDHAIPAGVNLIITADCGSASHQAIQIARDLGIDVIVSDHHKVSGQLPPALAVINPNRLDCNAEFEHLSGVGVAFCLLICLRKYLRDLKFWNNQPEPNLKELCDLVAIGTVADIVPLIKENRIFTKTGLAIMASRTRSGTNALMEASRIKSELPDADDIAFRLAPRINAAGRMVHAGSAVDLLTTKDPGRAGRIAQELNALNSKRQNTEQKITADIQSLLKQNPGLLGSHSMVMAHSGWHEGVLGIAASRIVEQLFRPVVLLSIKEGIGKGSARSIPGFDLYNGLSACGNDLEAFGGHHMAAGLTIKPDKIDRFRLKFERIVQEMTCPEDFIPTIRIDQALNFNEITPELINELETLKPFGIGNPEPIFAAADVRALSSRVVGKKHRQLVLSQSGNPALKPFQAIHFNIDPAEAYPQSYAKMAFRIRWNRWKGNQTPQLVVEDTGYSQ
jgi:single-stranded-DNA-specific exonuclease